MFFLITIAFQDGHSGKYTSKTKEEKNDGKVLTLQDCISKALENNHKIKASKENIGIAAAHIKLAQSGYFPQLSLKANYTLMDQDPLFVLPSSKYSLPQFLPGVSLPDVEVPQQDVIVMDKQNLNAGLELIYPFFTGGKISSINKQASYGYEIALLESKKTDIEIIYDVKRFYYSFILCKNLLQIAEQTLEKLNATLNLTEELYKNGSGKVTKLDYLKNKVIVDQVGSFVIELKRNFEMSREALIFSLGEKLDKDFNTSDSQIPFLPLQNTVENVLLKAYENNPDWSIVNSSVEIYDSKIDEAESGYFPNLAFFANLNQIVNSYEYGSVNKNNKTMWTIGLGLEMPIFSGFKTKADVEKSEAELKRIKEERLLLQDAIILQVKEAYYKVTGSAQQVEKILESQKTAQENTSLTERAFNQDLAEAGDLVEAQILEAIISAQYQKALYDHIEAKAKLEFITGMNLDDK